MSSGSSFEKTCQQTLPPEHGHAALELDGAARCLRRGGVLVFPTETFYGLGCLAANAAAVAQVYQIKRRPVHKPLPLLAADLAQVDAVACLAALPQELCAFWPGPLTVLLPARPGLPAALVNAQGLAAVRVTSHPLAAALARRAGGALTASSANMGGGRPVRSPHRLDPALLAALARLEAVQAENLGNGFGGVLSGGPLPAGGRPSTVVQPLPETAEGRRLLRVLRAGAVGAAELEAAGFALAAQGVLA